MEDQRAPVVLAPAAYQRLMHPEGELGSVRGAIRHAVPFVLSSNATVSIEETMAVPGARCWFQLYVQGDRQFTRDSIARVEAADCEAVCVTVDRPVLGLRPRQLRAGFSIPAEIPLPHAARLRAASDPLLVDGGIRRGTDALKALIRGANAVLIGRPYLYALAVGGTDGLARSIIGVSPGRWNTLKFRGKNTRGRVCYNARRRSRTGEQSVLRY
jgi:isopentenyl diphosphate isomerase/L-lactate dehydrogenase-like FMN-dependent dehydrogenase